MFYKKYWMMIVVLLMSIAVACTPAGNEPAAPGDSPAEQVGEEASSAARLALASFLGISPDDLTFDKIEEMEWSDSCLGLGGPAESCLAAITPGYAITFTVDGESYVVRTDLEGDAVRVEAAAETGGDALPPSVDAALAALMRELGIERDAIQVIEFSQQEWRESCLGLGGPAES